MLAGLGIYAVAGLLFTFAGSMVHLIPIRILQGVGSSMTVPMAMAYIGDMAPKGQEGPYMGYLNIVLFVVMGVGEALVWPVLGAFAIEEGRRYGQGSMMGVFNMAVSAGVFLSSVMAGLFMDLYGLGFAFYSIAVIVIVSVAVACWLIVAGENKIAIGQGKGR